MKISWTVFVFLSAVVLIAQSSIYFLLSFKAALFSINQNELAVVANQWKFAEKSDSESTCSTLGVNTTVLAWVSKAVLKQLQSMYRVNKFLLALIVSEF